MCLHSSSCSTFVSFFFFFFSFFFFFLFVRLQPGTNKQRIWGKRKNKKHCRVEETVKKSGFFFSKLRDGGGGGGGDCGGKWASEGTRISWNSRSD